MADTLTVIPVAGIPGVEPEEAPTKRVIDHVVRVNLGSNPDVVMKGGRPALDFPNAQAIGQIAAPITTEMPAGEVANALRKRCARCVHFRGDLWRETKRVWASSPIGSEKHKALAQMILQLARSVTEDLPTPEILRGAERSLDSWGICGALTEEKRDLQLAHPDACCPDEIDRYRDASKEARRAGSKTFDAIMNLAQGRKP